MFDSKCTVFNLLGAWFYCLCGYFYRVMTVMGTIDNCSGVLNDVLNGLASVSERKSVWGAGLW